MTPRRTRWEIPTCAAFKECLCITVDGGKLPQEVACHLHLAETVEEHRQRQVHQCHALLVALIQGNRRIPLLDCRVDEHELITAPECIMLRETEHFLTLLCGETQLAGRQKCLQIGETQEHIGLR